MKVQQMSLTEDNWIDNLPLINIDASLFLLFVSPEFKLKQEILDFLCKRHPDATIIGCSTAGEISDVTVNDNTISLTAIQFEKTTLKKVSVKVDDMDSSFIAGQDIGSKLYGEELKHVIVLSLSLIHI